MYYMVHGSICYNILVVAFQSYSFFHSRKERTKEVIDKCVIVIILSKLKLFLLFSFAPNFIGNYLC